MTTTAIINLDLPGPIISRHVYGHFAEHLGRCIYGGFWVSEDPKVPNVRGIRADSVEALRALRIPNLRWPGGCFADTYHWRDGVGPREQRPRMVNSHWGDVVEDNSFGTHEFLDLCELLGAQPYVSGNVGSGSVREMAERVEYLTRAGDSPMARSTGSPSAQATATTSGPRPCAVAPAAFDGVREHPRGLLVELPPHSYLTAELQLT
jgi:alpha-L-arabinofuranosidase